MYYILNHTDQIIAADNTLLQYLDLNNIETLTKQIIFEKIKIISSVDNTLQIHIKNEILHFTSQTISLNSILGNLTLVYLEPIEATLTSLNDTLVLDEETHDSDKSTIREKEIKEDFSTLIIPNIPHKTIDDITLDEDDNISFVKNDSSSDTNDIVIKDNEPNSLDSIESTDVKKDSIKPEEIFLEKFEDIAPPLPTIDTFNNEPASLDTSETTHTDTEKDFIKSEEINLEEPEDIVPPLPTIDTFNNEPASLDTSETTHTDTKKDFIKSEEINLEEPENTITKEYSTTQDKDLSLNSEPIIIPITEVSSQIGISTDDYNSFLNEYIDTAISLESDLQNTDTRIRNNAIDTLTQLADVLHLPKVNHIISKLNIQSPEENQETIEVFYNVLSRFTTQIDAQQVQDNQQEAKKITVTNEDTSDIHLTIDSELPENKHTQEPQIDSIKVEDIEPIQLNQDIPLKISEDNTIETVTQGFGTLDLKDIKPIHFDFQLSQAANDLMLPVELIEEFVHDFIDQAHSETKNMLEAYTKGDLDAVQKIGHLLKGASSNLRINALSDTLYHIQFCEDSSKLEKLIKQYWGQFLSFEQQIKTLSR